jgi:hypothetical protein
LDNGTATQSEVDGVLLKSVLGNSHVLRWQRMARKWILWTSVSCVTFVRAFSKMTPESVHACDCCGWYVPVQLAL